MASPPGDAPPAATSAASASAVLATCAAHGLTAGEFGRLRERATAAKAAAYCPYSGFRVGAAVLWGPDATVTPGANVESASYPVGACAERAAVAVATDVSPPASPCGMCRQLSVSPPPSLCPFALGLGRNAG